MWYTHLPQFYSCEKNRDLQKLLIGNEIQKYKR